MPFSRNGKSKNVPAKYQLLPDLPPEGFEVLKADIAEHGLQYPIIQDECGDTLDGHQRLRALRELGIKNYPIHVIGGMTDEAKRQYALSVNVKRRHLTTAQKRVLIEQELKHAPDISNSWLAELLGVDDKTIKAVRKRLEATSEIPKLTKLRGKDGKQRCARYNRIIANTPRESELARAVIGNLPSDDGRILDTTTAQRRARRNVQREAMLIAF